MLKNALKLLPVTALSLALYGCGGAPPQELDDAAIQEHLARHQHVSASSYESEAPGEGEGGVCYCYTCAKHHPPECL